MLCELCELWRQEWRWDSIATYERLQVITHMIVHEPYDASRLRVSIYIHLRRIRNSHPIPWTKQRVRKSVVKSGSTTRVALEKLGSNIVT